MKPLTDYSHIRGFCHHVDTDDVRLRRELGYAKKLDLNSTKFGFPLKSMKKIPRDMWRDLSGSSAPAGRWV